MKRRNTIRFAFLSVCLFASGMVAAQGVGNDEVIVVRELEADIQDARKLEIAPEIPDFTIATPKLTYEVKKREFKNFTFEANPAKPLAMSKEKLEKHNTSYLRLGFGSQFTPLAELAYHDNRSKNIRFGLLYNHLSSKAKRQNMQFSDDQVNAYFAYGKNKVKLGADFGFTNLRNHFYGYSDTSFSRKEVMQRYRTYGAGLFATDLAENKLRLKFNTELKFNFTEEYKGGYKEYFIFNSYRLDKAIKKWHHVLFHFDFDVSSYYGSLFKLNRQIYRVDAGYRFDNDDWMGRAKIGVGVDGKKAYPLPDLELEKRLYQHALLAFAGWNISLQKNSMQSLSNSNNFIQSGILLLNSRIDNRFVGIKGNLSGLSYRLMFSNKVMHQMPLFVTDSTDTKRFDVRYDKVTDYNFNFGISYDWKNRLHVALDGNYHALKAERELQPWHLPAFDLNFKARYNLKEKFVFDLGVISYAGIKAWDTSTKQVVNIKGTADVSVGFTYLFSKRFSFFGRLNNLANMKFERYYRYPTIGFNGLAGAQFAF